MAWKAGAFIHSFVQLIKLSVSEHMIVYSIYVKVTGKNKSHDLCLHGALRIQ